MNLNPPTVRIFTFAAALTASSLACADHNSPWGEDWATDAMDVHDARFDSLNDDSITGSEFLADSLLDTGPGFDALPGMGGSALDVASGGGGGMGSGMGRGR